MTRWALALIVATLLPFGRAEAQVLASSAGRWTLPSGRLHPSRLALGPSGDLYVADPRAGAIRVFDATGRVVRTLKTGGTPTAVAVDRRERILVADLSSGEVRFLDSDGGQVRALGAGRGAVGRPVALALDAVTGEVFVADAAAGSVHVFGPEGHARRTLSVGATPAGIAVESSRGRLFVAAPGLGEVRVFDREGALLGSIGAFCSPTGGLVRPSAVALGESGDVFVVDAFLGRIAAFRSSGAFRGYLGTRGTQAGQLSIPLDAVVSPDGRLFVASAETASIQIFQVVSEDDPRAEPLEPAFAARAASASAPGSLEGTAQLAEPGALPASGCGTAGRAPLWLAALLLPALLRRRGLASLAVLAVALGSPDARAANPPHGPPAFAQGCDGCHLPHEPAGGALTSIDGVANLCLSCHATLGTSMTGPDQAVPGVHGSSHRWDAPAANAAFGAQPPTDPAMASRLDGPQQRLTCAVCHNPHSQKQPPFDPLAPATAGSAGRHFLRVDDSGGQLCLACHSSWVMTEVGPPQTSGARLSHPVGVALPQASEAYRAPPLDADGRAQIVAVRGKATGGSATRLDDAGATFGALAGLRVRLLEGANAGEVRRITTSSPQSLTLDAALPAPVAAGVGYEIDGDGNTTNDLLLDDAGHASAVRGRVTCQTCHSVHDGDSDSSTHAPGPGDGRLLRRTFDSGACAGCHAVATHSSAVLGAKYGTWGADIGCPTCHRAHGSTNASLVREQVTTPAGTTAPVRFTARAGPNSLADGDGVRDGACEVCHTKTRHFRADGTGPDPLHAEDLGALAATDCTSCHPHEDGFKPICAGCHLPTPADEDYPGGGGAHAKHVQGLGYRCSACHSGAQHNQAGATSLQGIVQANVQIGFAPATFPSGTSATGQGTPTESYGGGNPTCSVGCHNPIRAKPANETPNLVNVATWTAGPLACTKCHDTQGAQMKGGPVAGRSFLSFHDYTATTDATVRADCGQCHSAQGHTTGPIAVVPRGGSPVVLTGSPSTEQNPLCLGCHTAAAVTLNGRTAPNVSGFASASGDFHGVRAGAGSGGALLAPYARGQAALPCRDCHDHHASENRFLLARQINGTGLPSAAVDALGRGGEKVCTSCHSGEWHQYCVNCHGYNPISPPEKCFYCHTHAGIQNFADPDDCDHCHGGWFPRDTETVPPVILAGPTVTAYANRAVVTWTTNEAANSTVDFGIGATNLTTSDGAFVTSHSIALVGLARSTTYTYRVRTADWYGNLTTTSTFTFTTTANTAPTAPVLDDQVDRSGPANPVALTLSWKAATDAEGDASEYQVEVSAGADFTTLAATSPWTTALSWATSLPSGATYRWRVVARNVGYPADLSAWSSVDTFALVHGLAPPVLVHEVGYESTLTEEPVTLDWGASTGIDADPIEYSVQISSDPAFGTVSYASGWLAANTWSLSVGTNVTWYWRVMARDSVHPATPSIWSLVDAFAFPVPSSSCPLVFSWDGTQFRYQSDLAGAPLDSGTLANTSVAYFRPRYVPLDGLVADAQGMLRAKIREPLSENAYIDQARLVAVDHPLGTELYDTTYDASGWGEPSRFELYAVDHAVPPASALTTDGLDVTAQVSALDGQPSPIRRVAEFGYVLDFGPVAHPENAKLLIDGWLLVGLPSSGIGRVRPAIQVQDGSGAWVTVAVFGFPIGDLKRFVVPIPSPFRSADRRIRVLAGGSNTTGWVIDRIRLDDSASMPVQAQTLDATVADLHYQGNLTYRRLTLEHPMTAADDVVPSEPSLFGYGAYTRYGDVRPLLQANDDRFAIMRHADEISLAFAEPLLPPGPGVKRSYLLEVDLYYKSYKKSRTVEPLPFAAMSAYPPPAGESYPSDPAHQTYLQHWNTRVFVP